MNIDQLYPSNYLKAADVKAQPRVVTIVSVAVEEVAQGESKPVLKIAGEDRGLVLNKTNGMLLAAHFSNETDAWAGKQIELYSEPVSFQGRIVDSIRVRQPTAAPVVPPVAQAELNDSPEDAAW